MVGLDLLIMFGIQHVVFFMFSAIPLVLIYLLLIFWYGIKRAKAYGIFIMILLAAVFIIVFVIIPLGRA